jgi:hypothetical protein
MRGERCAESSAHSPAKRERALSSVGWNGRRVLHEERMRGVAACGIAVSNNGSC